MELFPIVREFFRLIFYCIPARRPSRTMHNGARNDNASDSVNGSSYLPSFFDAAKLCAAAAKRDICTEIRTLRIIYQDVSRISEPSRQFFVTD